MLSKENEGNGMANRGHQKATLATHAESANVAPSKPPASTRGVADIHRPYPAYARSGVEWLGELPDHWTVRRFKFLGTIRNEKLFEKPAELPYVGLEHIESWTGRLLLGIQPESVESIVSRFGPSDILFGKLRPY